MSALLPRLAAGSLGTAVALAVLAAPTAALAAPGNGQGAASPAPAAATSNAPAGSAGGAAAGRSAAHAGAAKQGAPAAATAPRRGAASETAGRDGRATADAAQERAGQRAEPRRARPDQGRPAPQADRGKAAPQAETPKKNAAAPRTATADPRGNNGTFKVDGPVLDTSHGNEPHVACAFRLNFFGYDAGQLATISFTAIAPTPGTTTTVEGLQIVSTSPAQGGLYGGSYPVTGTWSAADLGLDPTVRQHVKVSVESLNADGSDVPGGAKHKVFWLEPCAAAAPVAVTTASVPFVGPVAAPTGIVGTSGTEAATAPAAAVAPEQAAAPATAAAPVSAAPVTLAAVSAQGAVAAQPFFLPHGTPRSTSTPTPGALPFTGPAPLLALLAGAVVSLLAGAGFLAAARRSA